MEARWTEIVEGRELDMSAFKVCSRLPSEERTFALDVMPLPRKKRYSRDFRSGVGLVGITASS